MPKILLAAGLLMVTTRQVGAVTLTSDNRSVSASVQAPPDRSLNSGSTHTEVPSVRFADRNLNTSGRVDWEDVDGWTPAPTYASARQDVTLLPNQIGMNAVLFVSVGGDPYGIHCPPGASGTAWASSVFDIGFSVTSPTEYSYLFDFDPTSTLTAANLSLISDDYGSQQLTRTFGTAVSGLLDPGNYTLHYVFSSRAMGAQSGYNSSSVIFNFTSGSVPEPTIFALFAMGLIALSAMGRKQLKGAK